MIFPNKKQKEFHVELLFLSILPFAVQQKKRSRYVPGSKGQFKKYTLPTH